MVIGAGFMRERTPRLILGWKRGFDGCDVDFELKTAIGVFRFVPICSDFVPICSDCVPFGSLLLPFAPLATPNAPRRAVQRWRGSSGFGRDRTPGTPGWGKYLCDSQRQAAVIAPI